MPDDRLQQLHDALLDAFPSEGELRLLLNEMGLPPSATPVGTRSLSVMMLDVIEYVTSRGLLDKLLTASACALRPHHVRLQEVVRQYWHQDVPPPPPIVQPHEASQRRPRDLELTEKDWQNITRYLREKKCTPVIGPGACRGVLPDSVALAGQWADQCRYPFADRTDLARVSQFLALTEYPLLPHEQLHERYAAVRSPDFDSPGFDRSEPHALLADLDLPLYLTTNYDDFMVRALAGRHRPKRSFPCWNPRLAEHATPGEVPLATVDSPLVYHLFGHHDVTDSMVLTEDDHFDFLASVADPRLFPPAVKYALGGTSLLFVGYEVLDWPFRVLVRALLDSITVDNRRLGVAVQLPPEGFSVEQRTQVETYLAKFLENVEHIHLRVFWGSTQEFTRILRDKWEEEKRRHAAG